MLTRINWAFYIGIMYIFLFFIYAVTVGDGSLNTPVTILMMIGFPSVLFYFAGRHDERNRN